MIRDERPALRKCTSCNQYTLEIVCPKCDKTALSPGPAKYSPEDKYARHRRQYKKENGL